MNMSSQVWSQVLSIGLYHKQATILQSNQLSFASVSGCIFAGGRSDVTIESYFVTTHSFSSLRGDAARKITR